MTHHAGLGLRDEHLGVRPLVQCLYPARDRPLHGCELLPRSPYPFFPQLLYAIFINVNAGSASAVQAGHHGLFKVFKGWYNIYPQVRK
jgi:hypothetical protein